MVSPAYAAVPIEADTAKGKADLRRGCRRGAGFDRIIFWERFHDWHKEIWPIVSIKYLQI